jgi:uncharacterized repeat protein (TIGR03803 family)
MFCKSGRTCQPYRARHQAGSPRGNLYGTTDGGGADGYGVVFKLAPNPDGTWTESVLHSFTGGADGYGVVFKLKPNSSGWSETVLHSFLGFGSDPQGGVIFDPAGNLYGTTANGNPAFDYGLVFEIAR